MRPLPWWRRPLPWRGGCASAPPLPCWRWCWDGSSGSWPWPPRPGGGWRGAGGAASSWRAGLSLQRAWTCHPGTPSAHSPLQHPPWHQDTLQSLHPLQHPLCHWDTLQGCNTHCNIHHSNPTAANPSHSGGSIGDNCLCSPERLVCVGERNTQVGSDTKWIYDCASSAISLVNRNKTEKNPTKHAYNLHVFQNIRWIFINNFIWS